MRNFVMSKKVSSAYLLFCLVVVSYFIKYGLNVFLARHLTADVYGDFSLAIRILAIFITLSLFGTNVSAYRFLSKYLQSDNKLTAANYIAWNIKLISVTFLISFVLALVSFVLILTLHFLGINDINQYHLTIYMLWITPFAAVSVLLKEFLFCSNSIFLPTIYSNVLLNVILLMLFMVITLFFKRELDNLTIVTVLFIGYVSVSFLLLLLVNNDFLLMLKSGLKQLSTVPITNTKWLQTSSRLISNNIIFMMIGVLDLVMVNVFSKNTLNVGHYAAVLTITSIVALIPNNLYVGLKAKISSLSSSERGRIELQKELDKVNPIVIVIIAVLGALIICFSKTLLSHFGPSYIIANCALITLTIGVCISSATRIAPMLLSYTGFEKELLVLTISELVIMLILVAPATYYFDITGAATATAFVMCIKPLATVYLVRNRLSLRSVLLL